MESFGVGPFVNVLRAGDGSRSVLGRSASGLRSQRVDRCEALRIAQDFLPQPLLDFCEPAGICPPHAPEAIRALEIFGVDSIVDALRAGTARAPHKTSCLDSPLLLNGLVKEDGPPRNPGVRELVAGKRKWASTLTVEQAKRGFKGWHERGYLPHRDEPGLTQMITFHVVDSFPASLRSEWERLLQIEDNDERRKKLQAYLDKGRGECALRQPGIASLVQAAFRYHHGKNYELRAWVIMPNHVHVLFKIGKKPMGKVIADWKEYTSREANHLLNRRGQFWAFDYWDTFMRNAEHELRAQHYTESNPVKAGLVRAAKDWPWSSARFRDEYGRLVLEQHS